VVDIITLRDCMMFYVRVFIWTNTYLYNTQDKFSINVVVKKST
jgi:hypothetical protein